MIKINAVTKKFDQKVANENINISINAHEVYGLIGPNGSGKTTLIRQIMGFVKPDAGEIIINSINVWNNSEKLMPDIGYIPGELKLYESITGKKFLDYLFSLRENIDQEYFKKLVSFFEIDLSEKIKKMSKGTKQKLAIIAAVVFKPKILILDEPTSGLDPLMQNKFNKLIVNLQKNGTTILLCSHIFDQVAKLCHKIGFIKNGLLVQEYELKNTTVEELNTLFLKLYEKETEF